MRPQQFKQHCAHCHLHSPSHAPLHHKLSPAKLQQQAVGGGLVVTVVVVAAMEGVGSLPTTPFHHLGVRPPPQTLPQKQH